MKNLKLPFIALALSVSGTGAIQAQDELVYVAVEPCRVADTRKSAGGPVKAGSVRNFRIVGSAAELAAQGGLVNCENPKDGQRPVAVSAYVLAVPANTSSGTGVLSAYPSDQPPPPAGSGSTVNFAKDQVIGNTTIATLCSDDDCPANGELAILSRVSNEHVVLDVQGYFYPQTAAPGYVIVQAPFSVANRDSLIAQASCPNNKKVLSGGGNALDSTWFMDGSYPLSDGSAWRVSYRSTGATFSIRGAVWAICATVD